MASKQIQKKKQVKNIFYKYYFQNKIIQKKVQEQTQKLK